MKTATICIGNSDHRLKQLQWSCFNKDMRRLVQYFAIKTQFSGSSPGDAPWQNTCWVINLEDGKIAELRTELALIAAKYSQDSIALVIGETEIIARQPRVVAETK